jgi:biotin carboxylase
MSNLICLGGGVESVPMIRRVKEMGHRAIVVDANPKAPGFEVGDDARLASCYHIGQAIMALDDGGHYDGVLCCGVDAPVMCAKLAQEFHLPGLSVEAALLGQDKYRQKEAMQRAGILVPEFSGVLNGATSSVLRSGDKRVVKPVDSRGGRGVIRLLPGVDPAWAYEQAVAQSPSGRVMVEKWLDGPQFSTESIVQDGHVLATAIGLRNYDRLTEFVPYAIEDGIDTPAYLTSFHARAIDTVIEAACKALGWYQTGAGTVKGDLVSHQVRIHVIELACRLSGGFFASHSMRLAFGIDLVEVAIRAALGESVNVAPPAFKQHVCQRYVFPLPADIGKTVVAIEEYAGPEFHTYNLRIGDVVQPVTCHPARWGQVIATGATAREAADAAECAADRMYAGVRLA